MTMARCKGCKCRPVAECLVCIHVTMGRATGRKSQATCLQFFYLHYSVLFSAPHKCTTLMLIFKPQEATELQQKLPIQSLLLSRTAPRGSEASSHNSLPSHSQLGRLLGKRVCLPEDSSSCRLMLKGFEMEGRFLLNVQL